MQQLLLSLKVFLFQMGWSQIVYSQSQGPPEVMIPLKITHSASSMKSSDWISYSLKFEGKRHIVHMKLIKYLLARHMPVFTYTDQGTLHEDYPFIQNNCYYYGYMDEDPKSQVSLNTCFGGLKGYLHKNSTVYKVEPKLNSTTFEHLVYRLVNEEKEFPTKRFGLKGEEFQIQLKIINVDDLPTSRQSEFMRFWTHRRYYKLAIVVNKNLYHDYGSNITAVQYSITTILNLVNVYYATMDLIVILMGLEIWTDRNYAETRNAAELLRTFCLWKERSLSLRIPHNTGILLAPSIDELYRAYLNAACFDHWKCAVIEQEGNFPVPRTAVAITKVVGLQIGIYIDRDHCECGNAVCLMTNGVDWANNFSNCSYASFYEAKTECLFSAPKQIIEERCGNGVPEEGEACDCGTLDSCAADPCCETDCRLARGAQCAYGLCCKKCQFLPSGTLCRKQENECDLPEWCNGTHAQCPDDVFVQGGIPCRRGGVCYDKRCNTREEQCRRLFGEQAKSARMSCYTDVNTRGDRFGNCGLNTTSYTPCPLRDSLCGRLQCENVKMIPKLQYHHTWISTNISGTVCWGVDYHLGVNYPDKGEVQDGTECGEQKICVEGRCIPVSHFTIRCSPEQCSMHGICNNRHHCHCNSPWRPPLCYATGVGGSVDSGPPPGSFVTESEDFSTEFESEDITHTHVCFYLLLLRLFLFLLIFLAILSKAII